MHSFNQPYFYMRKDICFIIKNQFILLELNNNLTFYEFSVIVLTLNLFVISNIFN